MKIVIRGSDAEALRRRSAPARSVHQEVGDMKALTLWRPWTDGILNAGKRVENRRRPPPTSMLGKRFALHAGKRYELGDWSTAGWDPPKDRDCAQGIVGVAHLVGYLDLRDERRFEACVDDAEYNAVMDRLRYLDEDPWWSGPVGWLLDRVIAFEPVACRGAQGLWTVPEPQLALIRERLRTKTRKPYEAPTIVKTENFADLEGER